MTDFEKLANSESMDDMIKAASDPKCPAKIIDQIIMNEELSWSGPKGEELMGATAANPNTESHHLSNCWNATQIESHRLSILKNPNCPEELQEDLLHYDSIDRKLALLDNPSVFWVYSFLKIIVDEPFGSKLIKAISDRPEFKDYKIKPEHKESIDKIDNLLFSDNFDTGMELLNALDDPDLKIATVYHLANYKVRLAENHDEWSENDIETIIKKNNYSSGDEAEPDLFYKISTHPKTPEVWLEDFALSGNHDDMAVYEIALKCRYESLLYELYKDDTKSAVIQNKNFPKELLLKVREENVGSELIDEYFNHIHGIVSSELDQKTVEILSFKSNIADLMDKHSNESDDVWIKKSKLSSDDLGEDYFEAIYNDKNSKIRLAVLNNPFTPEDILIKLVDDSNIHIQLAVLSHSKCSEEILKKASEKNEVYLDSRLRKAVALNPNCSKEIVNKLIKDEYRWVRRAAASHPNINKEEIKKLIKSGDRYVLRGLTINPNCPDAESNSINDLLSDEEKYPIEFNDYTIGSNQVFTIVEHKTGFVDFENIMQGIMEGEDWSSYVWSDWYNYDDLIANYGPTDLVDMVEFPDGSSCSLKFEDNSKPFEIKIGDKTIFEGREEAFLSSTTSWESGDFEFSTITLQNEFKVECLTVSPDEEGENVIYRHYDYEDDESGESDFSEGELLTSETDSTDITLYVKSTEEGIQYCEEFDWMRERLSSDLKLEEPYSDEDGPKIIKWLEENFDTWW